MNGYCVTFCSGFSVVFICSEDRWLKSGPESFGTKPAATKHYLW